MKSPSLPILVVDDVVRLRGKLDNAEISRAAVKKTSSIKGVKKAVNLLG